MRGGDELVNAFWRVVRCTQASAPLAVYDWVESKEVCDWQDW
jgi:hypothetical protein